MFRSFLCTCLVVLSCSPAFGQAAISGVSILVRDTKDRVPDRKQATLALDDAARRLVINSREAPLAIDYDNVSRVIVEGDTAWHSPSFAAAFASFFVGGIIFGPSLTASIDKPLQMAHLVFIEYRKPDGASAAYEFTASKESAPLILRRLKAAFGERLVLPTFPERLEALGDERYKSVEKYEVRGAATEHPLPQPQTGKALVVVACPATGGLKAVQTEKFVGWGGRLLVDDQVVGATGPGTYTFFYLDPGEHLVVSLCPGRCRQPMGIRLNAEAGGEYYLIHTVYIAGNLKSFLARHSPEVVSYELPSLLWAEWRPAK